MWKKLNRDNAGFDMGYDEFKDLYRETTERWRI